MKVGSVHIVKKCNFFSDLSIAQSSFPETNPLSHALQLLKTKSVFSCIEKQLISVNNYETTLKISTIPEFWLLDLEQTILSPKRNAVLACKFHYSEYADAVGECSSYEY